MDDASNLYVAHLKTKDGKDAWHIILVDKPKVPLFLEAMKSPKVDVAKFGKVLHSGWGKNPPADILEKVKKGKI